MNKFEKLSLENDLKIMEFLLYPQSSDNLIKQKNKIIEVLAPQSDEMGFEKDIEEPKIGRPLTKEEEIKVRQTQNSESKSGEQRFALLTQTKQRRR